MDKPNPANYGLSSGDLCSIHNRIHASPLCGEDLGLLLAAIIFLPTLIVPIVCLSKINWDRLLPVSKDKMKSYMDYQEADKKWIDWYFNEKK